MTNGMVRDNFLPFSCKLIRVRLIKLNRLRKSNVYKSNLNYLYVVGARDPEGQVTCLLYLLATSLYSLPRVAV